MAGLGRRPARRRPWPGRIPPFGARWVLALLHGRTAQAWPGVPTPLVAVAGAVLAAVLAAVGLVAWRAVARRATRPGDPVAALSRDRAVRQLGQSPAAEKGIRLRPSLAGTRPGRLDAADIGLLLGRLKQPAGDGPGCSPPGKTPCSCSSGRAAARPPRFGVPYVLSAPGPVVATSVKADLWAVTAELRAASGSRHLDVRPAGGHRRRAAVLGRTCSPG